MLPNHRAELRRVINSVFELGVNKERMLSAMEQFIDVNYSELSHSKNYVKLLQKEIETAKGIGQWKRKLAKELYDIILNEFTIHKTL